MFSNLLRQLYGLHALKRNQRRKPLELEGLQEKKLMALLRHAYYKVDYYRKVFDRAKIRPEDIRRLQDIAKIPLTTKKTLQGLSKREIIAKDATRVNCLNLRTSGSTGMPLDIIMSNEEIASKWLFYLRMYLENGGRLSDKELMITAPRNFSSAKWFQKLGILERNFVSIFDDTESLLRVILRFRPDIIRSNALVLKQLAAKIKERAIKDIRPRLVFSNAELLTRQDRVCIASAFNAELFDFYSCNECGIIAWECKEHSGYHINSENVIVEFLREDGTKTEVAEEGEIVVTSLNSYTMPFIRYRLGDMGIPFEEACPCGRTLPLMKLVTGRINDCIILPNGRKISPYICMMTMDRIPEIKNYQIIQHEKDKVRINILRDKMITDETVMQVARRYEELFYGGLKVMPALVENISRGKAGKAQVVISKLAGHEN